MGSVLQSLITLWESTGIARLFGGDLLFFLKTLAMYLIVGVLVYFAIKKQYEPLLLLPIAVGMLLTNLPGAELFHMDLFINESDPHAKVIIQDVFNKGGLIDLLYLGVKFGIYPSLIFIGIGAMTDFTPLISNPKSIFLGGAAQLGVFAAFCGALLLGFDPAEAAAIPIFSVRSRSRHILIWR